MWYKFAQNILEGVDQEADKASQKMIEKEFEDGQPFVSEIENPNQIAQYVSYAIADTANRVELPKKEKGAFSAYEPEQIFSIQEKMFLAADQALKESSIFNEKWYGDIKPILDTAFKTTTKFRGLVDYFDANERPYVSYGIKRYIYDFAKVFRYIFLLHLKKIFGDFKPSYHPYYTKVMKEWKPETQDHLWSNYVV